MAGTSPAMTKWADLIRASFYKTTLHNGRETRENMAKAHASFVCQNCGAVYPRWGGKCEACGEWNTITEEGGGNESIPAALRTKRKGRAFTLEPLAGQTEEAPRTPSGIREFDRVTGGGFVRGSILLLGGDPGIGKSTLLIEAAASLAKKGKRVVYVSGEEAIAQVRMRATRLGLGDAKVELAAETNVEDILATLKDSATPALVVANFDPDALDRDRRTPRPAPSRRYAPRRKRCSVTPRNRVPRSC